MEDREEDSGAPPYGRVLLKLSGDAFAPPDVHFGTCAHVPGAPEAARHTESESDRTESTPPPRKKNYSWSELLRRVFEIDILVCERCGGPVRAIAAIQEPKTTAKILNYLGLPSRPPPITPAPVKRCSHPDDFAS